MQPCKLCRRAVCGRHRAGGHSEETCCLECAVVIQAMTADYTQVKVQSVAAMAGVRVLIQTQLPASRMPKGSAGQRSREAYAAERGAEARRAGQCRRARLMGLNARPLTRGAAQVMQRLETCVAGEDANHATDGTADDEAERQQTVKDREQELAEMGGAATPAEEAILLQEEEQTAARLCKDEVRLAALVKRRQRVALMVRRQQAAPSERGGLPGGRWLT